MSERNLPSARSRAHRDCGPAVFEMPRRKPSHDQRVYEKIGWQAEAPAPPKRNPLCASVGQTLSSANPAIVAIFSQTQRERLPAECPYAV